MILNPERPMLQSPRWQAETRPRRPRQVFNFTPRGEIWTPFELHPSVFKNDFWESSMILSLLGGRRRRCHLIQHQQRRGESSIASGSWSWRSQVLFPRSPGFFLRIFLLRNASAGNHQLVAGDLMEDGTHPCLLTHAWKKTTANIRSWRIAICNCKL
jgi:hypothetical protein